MRQLVELQQHADEFKALNCEMIYVYREESEGVDGLKKIKESRNPSTPPFRLTLDFEKKSSKAYSPERMTFDNYVIDSKGTVRAVIDGTLRNRAKAAQILAALKEIQKEAK